MSDNVLITGGAGFIGSHVADELLALGYGVRALDNLCSQVHGPGRQRPPYLNKEVELIVGDVRDPDVVGHALKNIDMVVHLAAAVGVGQSMYEISHYTEVNNVGTAVLLEALAERSVKRLVVASSMSIYGEGLYCAPDGGHRGEVDRTVEQLRAAQWDPRESDGSILTPVPTPETKQPALASIYALSKYDQERMCMIIGRAYGLPSVALRLFNVYGPRQALSNPYTGALAIFASRILNGNSPLIYEDGYQLRDFVSVYDVARAFVLALENPGAPGEVFNIGSGQSYTINDLAQEVANVLGKPDIEPEITGKYRVGDIRHCFADVSRAREILGFTPQVSLEEGLADLGGWLEGQVAHDRIAEARAELAARRLTV